MSEVARDSKRVRFVALSISINVLRDECLRLWL
jgi:hypothetical protein